MERALVDGAAAGDEGAFRRLLEPHRRELHLHCYRMLGSVTDADDLLQETMLAAWRGLPDFDGRSSLRTWLYRIATRRCLNAIRDGKRRPPPQPVPPFTPPEPTARAEVTWLQPYPDSWLPGASSDRLQDPAERYRSREAIELAFLVALQRLPPRQTAAVVLGDVLGFGLVEIAATLSETPTATKGLLQRARATLARRPSAPPTPAPGSPEEQQLAARFAEAFAADDVAGVVSLLSDDAWLRMPPAQHEYHGPRAIGEFLRAATSWRPHRPFTLTPTRANGRPAFICALEGQAAGVIVLDPRAGRLGAVTRFLDPGVHAYCTAGPS